MWQIIYTAISSPVLTGTLGSLLPSPPTSLTHVPSLHSLLCQIALKSAFSPAFLFSLHIFCVGGLSGLVLSSACHKTPLLKSCSANEAFMVLSTERLHEYILSCETLQTQTQHVPISFPALCNTTAQPGHASCWFRCEWICSPSIPVSTNMKQHNSRAKLLCYQRDF